MITRATTELGSVDEADDDGVDDDNEGDDDEREEKSPYSAERMPIKIPFWKRKRQAKIR